MESLEIPTVDLSPFFVDEDENGRKKVTNIIGDACAKYGFFQIVNHGVPIELMGQALQLSKVYFQYSSEEKLKSSPKSNSPLPAGYGKQSDNSKSKNEYLLMFPPGSSFNVYPNNPPGFREILDEVFSYFVKTGLIVESIINECLGLPPNFLKEFNNDREWDLMTTFRYFPGTEEENIGVKDHKDVNFLTFVCQDEVGGLEVRKDGKWIPLIPRKDTLVVNVGDVIQVLSNDKFKSAIHRVVRQQGRDRHSYAFFYNISGEKWIEPLPHFTKEIKESPKYKRFLYKEYLQLRMRNNTHPPSKPEDLISINHYAIPPLQ